MTIVIPALVMAVIATLICLLMAAVGLVCIVVGGFTFLFSAAWNRGFTTDTLWSLIFMTGGVSFLIAVPIVFGALT